MLNRDETFKLYYGRLCLKFLETSQAQAREIPPLLILRIGSTIRRQTCSSPGSSHRALEISHAFTCSFRSLSAPRTCKQRQKFLPTSAFFLSSCMPLAASVAWHQPPNKGRQLADRRIQLRCSTDFHALASCRALRRQAKTVRTFTGRQPALSRAAFSALAKGAGGCAGRTQRNSIIELDLYRRPAVDGALTLGAWLFTRPLLPCLAHLHTECRFVSRVFVQYCCLGSLAAELSLTSWIHLCRDCRYGSAGTGCPHVGMGQPAHDVTHALFSLD